MSEPTINDTTCNHFPSSVIIVTALLEVLSPRSGEQETQLYSDLAIYNNMLTFYWKRGLPIDVTLDVIKYCIPSSQILPNFFFNTNIILKMTGNMV